MRSLPSQPYLDPAWLNAADLVFEHMSLVFILVELRVCVCWLKLLASRRFLILTFAIKSTCHSDDVHALEEALAVLRAILHESGLGALPIDPSQLSSLTSRTIAPFQFVLCCAD